MKITKKKPDFSSIQDSNPFSEHLVIRVRKKESGWHKDVDDMWMPNEVEMDAQDCFKTYCSREIRLARAELQPRALQLWDWIMQTIKYGEDVVWVDVSRYMRECGIKDPKTYRNAVVDLGVRRFIIAVPGMKNCFFINPSMGFKGSRINKYPGKVVWE